MLSGNQGIVVVSSCCPINECNNSPIVLVLTPMNVIALVFWEDGDVLKRLNQTSQLFRLFV